LDGILVGEVWLMVGDSNLQYRLIDEPNGKDLVAKASDPLLRFRETDIRPGIRPKTIGGGYWHPTAEPWIENTSAVAYFFGTELRQKLNVPVGIIIVCPGGPPISTFMSREALEKVPGTGLEPQLAEIAAREKVFPFDPAQQKTVTDDWGKRVNDWDRGGKQLGQGARRGDRGQAAGPARAAAPSGPAQKPGRRFQ
jgi:sialate O-acetylesterase